MIVEQRIYTLSPGALPAFLKAYREYGLPVHQEIYQRLIGYFTAESGVLNQVIQIWAFDDHPDRAERRARVQADPRWHAYLQRVQGLVTQQENRFLLPAAWSPEC